MNIKTIHIRRQSVDNLDGLIYVLVIVCDEETDIYDIDQLLNKHAIYRPKYILTWGENSEKIEDLIDRQIEDMGDTETITTSHSNELAREVANFILNGIFLDNEAFDCSIFYREGSKKARCLIKAIKL